MDDQPELELVVSNEQQQLSFATWLATDGGRRCPQCGRFAKPTQLGSLGGRCTVGHATAYLSAYGHLPGFGCNKPTH